MESKKRRRFTARTATVVSLVIVVFLAVGGVVGYHYWKKQGDFNTASGRACIKVHYDMNFPNTPAGWANNYADVVAVVQIDRIDGTVMDGKIDSTTVSAGRVKAIKGDVGESVKLRQPGTDACPQPDYVHYTVGEQYLVYLGKSNDILYVGRSARLSAAEAETVRNRPTAEWPLMVKEVVESLPASARPRG